MYLKWFLTMDLFNVSMVTLSLLLKALKGAGGGGGGSEVDFHFFIVSDRGEW